MGSLPESNGKKPHRDYHNPICLITCRPVNTRPPSPERTTKTRINSLYLAEWEVCQKATARSPTVITIITEPSNKLTVIPSNCSPLGSRLPASPRHKKMKAGLLLSETPASDGVAPAKGACAPEPGSEDPGGIAALTGPVGSSGIALASGWAARYASRSGFLRSARLGLAMPLAYHMRNRIGRAGHIRVRLSMRKRFASFKIDPLPANL